MLIILLNPIHLLFINPVTDGFPGWFAMTANGMTSVRTGAFFRGFVDFWGKMVYDLFVEFWLKN